MTRPEIHVLLAYLCAWLLLGGWTVRALRVGGKRGTAGPDGEQGRSD